jgi:hypothetical protein
MQSSNPEKITPKKLQAENFSTQKVKNSIFSVTFLLIAYFAFLAFLRRI